MICAVKFVLPQTQVQNFDNEAQNIVAGCNHFQIMICAVKFVLPQTQVRNFDNEAQNIVAQYIISNNDMRN